MKRTFLVGLSAAVIGGLGLFIASLLSIDLSDTIIGVGAGVIAATVHFGTPLQRLGGFLIGFVLGVFFIAMVLGILPGGYSVMGNAVALAIVLLVIALVHGFTRARIHAWAMLLGVLAFAAGVYPTLSADPFAAHDQLWYFVGTSLAMAMIGFLTVIPATLFPDRTSLAYRDMPAADEPSTSAEPEPGQPVANTSSHQDAVSLKDMMGGTQ